MREDEGPRRQPNRTLKDLIEASDEMPFARRPLRRLFVCGPLGQRFDSRQTSSIHPAYEFLRYDTCYAGGRR